jgi:hypothetical protein
MSAQATTSFNSNLGDEYRSQNVEYAKKLVAQLEECAKRMENDEKVEKEEVMEFFSYKKMPVSFYRDSFEKDVISVHREIFHCYKSFFNDEQRKVFDDNMNAFLSEKEYREGGLSAVKEIALLINTILQSRGIPSS